MDENLSKLFKQAYNHPESRLSDDVWHVLVSKNRKSVRIKFWVYSVLSSVSFISLFPILKQLGASFSRSGFYEYFSLAFSDGGGVAFSYWKEISLSLAQSLPTLSIILFLTIVFILITSLRFMVRNIRSPLLIAS